MEKQHNISDISPEMHSADIAAIISEIPASQAIALLEKLPISQQASILEYCPNDVRLELCEEMGINRFAELLNVMSHDDRADIIKALPQDINTKLLQAMSLAEREDIRRLASYPENTAGSIMTTSYAVLRPEMSVSEAIEQLRNQAADTETINRIYIVDDERKLLGMIKLKSLILSNASEKISKLMETNIQSVKADDEREYVAKLIAKYDVIALPVIDESEKIVGIVTHDDAFDVIEEKTTETIHKSSTIGKLSGNILHASTFLLYRKRILWLVILVFGNLFSGAGIAYFEDTIAAYVGLVFFLPLLIGSGGNAGSQSATLMVRALATGDVQLRDWGKMLGRELIIAAMLGLTMAFAVSFIGIYRGGYDLAFVVSLTMMVIVILGSLIGMSLPFILSRFKLDPATASSPLITSIADALGVIIYFSVASWYLV